MQKKPASLYVGNIIFIFIETITTNFNIFYRIIANQGAKTMITPKTTIICLPNDTIFGAFHATKLASLSIMSAVPYRTTPNGFLYSMVTEFNGLPTAMRDIRPHVFKQEVRDWLLREQFGWGDGQDVGTYVYIYRSEHCDIFYFDFVSMCDFVENDRSPMSVFLFIDSRWG